MNKLTIEYVWGQQKEIPVILRRTGKGQLLRLRMPYSADNRRWLQNDRRTIPAWLTSKQGRVPRGGVGTVDLRQDRVQVRRPVLAS